MQYLQQVLFVLLISTTGSTQAFTPPPIGSQPPPSVPQATSGLFDGFFQAPARPATVAKPVGVKGGLVLSPIGIGTWAWGNRFLWGYKESDDPALQQAFEMALSKGVNWLDTGDSYGTGRLLGQSEKLIGQFIREHDYSKKLPGGLVTRATDVQVATKLAPYPWRIGRGSITKAARESLDRLQQQKLGIVQLHWRPPLGWQESEYWAGLADVYRAGLARGVGLSNYGPKQLRVAQAAIENAGAPLSVNQVQFSLVSTLPVESGLVETAGELGVKLIAYSPLGLGLLTGKYNERRLPDGPRGLLFKELLPKIRPVLGTMEEISTARGGKPFAQIAINWARAKGALALCGVRTVKQAEENLGALSWQLTSAEVMALDKAVKASKGGQIVKNVFQSE